MSMAVLLSGATGFLGSSVIEELVTATESLVFALVRPKRGRTGEQRLQSLWCERPVLKDALQSGRVSVVEGDIEQAFLGLSPERYDALAKEVDTIIHTAAEVGVNESWKRLWNVNVRGTYHMLEFARTAQKAGGIRRYVHVSTAYVAGRQEGVIPERLFGDDQYNSLYERSKHEAELLISSYTRTVPSVIVRPPQIVGDSRTGFITTFNTLYYPLKRYIRGELKVLPASRDLKINMAPVDYVARVISRAACAEELSSASVLHAVGRPHELPSLGELIEAVRLWAHEYLHLELAAPVYLPNPLIPALGRVRNLAFGFRMRAKGPMRNLVSLAPYLIEKRSFEVANARALMGDVFPDWHDYLPHLLEFAVRRGFLHYTERTVFEQMLMRLRPGASTSIRYYDIKDDAIVPYEGSTVREDICRVAKALGASGVRPGVRVASLGVNSVRLLVLDAAIGLMGGVHVPIYYTSAPGDVVSLTNTSGATILFVGTDRMLEELDTTSLHAEIVALNGQEDLRPGIVPWSSFVARADQGEQNHAQSEQPMPYVSPDDVATIRYTSGTTGLPKGVIFTQQQVRWMAEVMPAVLDWRTRNAARMRYLSFLPMSHVVEGILVAYAPYYILANIDMYYLNDFSRLAEALPKVRPNLFFSVPRFYEKLWAQLLDTRLGSWWANLSDGLLKRCVAYPLRHVLLRKAGLDRCRQLMVGSAPMSLELLTSLRSLGIEVHNAFGVTEAPLITLSRMGENELGSVGALLPDTEVKLDDEGVVSVRGPQVTHRYDGMDEPAIDGEGWFSTGDLGSWSEAGYLVLHGRKKEILVTSYGKNIAPQKIEILLKGIDGVSEAMVVADGRPFTTALMWLEDETLIAVAKGSYSFETLDVGVGRVNKQLSHPEQVKRWAVCSGRLTIANGELTPNLKLRRGEVERLHTPVVDDLYSDWNDRKSFEGQHSDVLHWGES